MTGILEIWGPDDRLYGFIIHSQNSSDSVTEPDHILINQRSPAERGLAPSMGLTMEMEELPFSVVPDEKVSIQQVLAYYRETYEGTEFDASKNMLIPNRYAQDPDDPEELNGDDGLQPAEDCEEVADMVRTKLIQDMVRWLVERDAQPVVEHVDLGEVRRRLTAERRDEIGLCRLDRQEERHAETNEPDRTRHGFSTLAAWAEGLSAIPT